MRTIVRAPKALNLSEYKFRRAQEGDVGELVSESFQLIDPESGDTKAVYYVDCWDAAEDELLEGIYGALGQVRYDTTTRTLGLKTTSRVFGWKPRTVIRGDFCTATSMATEHPEQHDLVVRGAQLVARRYRMADEALYERHQALANARVLPEYHLEDEVFTSGIINENNPLAYHFDAGNFRNVWSGMLAFRHQTTHGYLALPAYNLAVAIAHKSLFLFDGQGILHGVTPIKLLSPDAKRYSIVYYSLRGMWNCDPLGTELDRAKRMRTAREQARAATPAPKTAQHSKSF
jgi:hypothetical protein